MRSTMQVYRQLGKYLEQMDAEAQARGDGPENKSVDVHFRSGVYLGVGLSHIMLSLMPARLATLVELFGYKGDRHLGLALLQKAGGWTKESPEPSVSQGAPPDLRRWRSETVTNRNASGTEDEGVRRSICDMTLLIFHLFLSSFTHDGVDVMMAQKIVDWNLKRYPEGSVPPLLFSKFKSIFTCSTYDRCLLPSRSGPAQFVSCPTSPRDRVLSEGDERTEPVPQFASRFILGDGRVKPCALGNRRVAQVLAQSPQRIDRMCRNSVRDPRTDALIEL